MRPPSRGVTLESWLHHRSPSTHPLRPAPGPLPCTSTIATRDSGSHTAINDLIVFLADAGLADPKRILDNRAVVQWQGAEAHQYKAA